MQIAKIYLSGPMSNLPDLNKPAFHAEAARLRALGYEVENPADVELAEGATWSDYMRTDLPLMLKCDTVVLLPGWNLSRGARLEEHIARSLGMHVVPSVALKVPALVGRAA